MRAAVVDSPGGLERLRIADIPAPTPGPNDVLIDVAFAALNWGDVQKREGIYPDPVTYPAVLGAEIAGTVRACGRRVRAFRVGQFVAAIMGPEMPRGLAEQAVVPARYVIPLAPDFDPRVAAAFPVVGLTAYHLLHTAHRLKRRETLLLHAAGGALGLVLTQMATRLGGRVIGTVGSPAKAEAARRMGAHRVVVRGQEDFVAVAMSETRGRGVDFVIDSLGGEILPRSFDALRPFGRVINIGEAAGEPEFPVRKTLYQRSTALAGFEVLHAEPGSRRWGRGVRSVVEAIAGGDLHVPIVATYPFAEICDAQARLEARGVAGKIVVAVNGEWERTSS